MLSQEITLPLWVVVLIVVLALLAFLDRLLLPSVRWFVRRRVGMALAEVNQRLRIHIQPFKLTKRRVLLDRLVYDPEVASTVDEISRSEGTPREVLQQRVQVYAQEIVPSFNAYVYFRFGYRLARRVAQALYRVRVGAQDEKALNEVDPGSTVVFVMNHRSNMDYLLVSYLVAESTALSYAVGEWACVWLLESIIRSMGAYFVRRKSRNTLYRKVLSRYVQMATAEGVTQAVYPEGGLTRDGALQPPRLGLFDYMLRSFDPQGERDIVFVPVGINYDRVLEDRTLLLDRSAMSGRPTLGQSAKRSFGFAVDQLRLLLTRRWHRFGYACVNFGRPVSARAFVAEHGIDFRELERGERFEQVAVLAERLMVAVGEVVPVLPTALVSAVLMSEPDRWVGELELKAECQELLGRLYEQGAQVYVPRQNADYSIGVGLRMLTLRKLVEQRDGLYRIVPEELATVRYYSNSIAHLVRPAVKAASETVAATD